MLCILVKNRSIHFIHRFLKIAILLSLFGFVFAVAALNPVVGSLMLSVSPIPPVPLPFTPQEAWSER